MQCTAQSIVDTLLEMKWDDRPPPRYTTGDDGEDVRNAARSAFTAHAHALATGKHHPLLLKAVQGSPYERDYRERFAHQILSP